MNILKKKSITNFDITDLSNKLDFEVTILMRDQSHLCINPGSYVLNFDTSDETGSHWVGCYIDKNIVYYCDSYGFPPPQEFITTWFSHRLKIKYCDNHIQDLDSTYCGFFAVCFLLYMNFGNHKTDLQNMNHYLSLFISNNYALDVKNNAKVKALLEHFLKSRQLV